MDKKTAVIIGAGPAGLSAAYELLAKTEFSVVIFETSQDVGGIAKSVSFKGNILDLGGHRYFSKSERVNQWWEEILPLQGAPEPDPEKTDRVMLIRRRFSRILFKKKLINYPLTFQLETFLKIGLPKIFKMGIGYFKAKLFPCKEENLEDFFINRFGKELYGFFFKSYSKKLWGVGCNQLSPEWGRQRIQNVSIPRLILKSLGSKFIKPDLSSLSCGHDREASMIDYFKYPKLGAGQLWDEVARIIKEKNSRIYLKHKVIGLNFDGERIISIEAQDINSGKIITMEGDYFVSTMPIKELIQSFKQGVPAKVREVADTLKYRSLITVGVLLRKMKIKNDTRIKTINNIIPDNWIYVQEKEFKLGRIQIFNNWSPYLVKDRNTIWLGLEYFCDEEGELWQKGDKDITEFAADELFKTGFIDKGDVLDSVVVRVPKAYPVYCGGYFQLDLVKEFVEKFENLFLIGRNGMHRYNNIDHSMISAMTAVENIINNIKDKKNIWSVNLDSGYCEKN